MRKIIIFLLVFASASCAKEVSGLSQEKLAKEKIRTIAKKHGAVDGVNYRMPDKVDPNTYDFLGFENSIAGVMELQKQLDQRASASKKLSEERDKELAKAKTAEEERAIHEKYIKEFEKISKPATAIYGKHKKINE